MSYLQEHHAYFFSLENFSVGSNLDPIEHRFNGEVIKEKLEKALENTRKRKEGRKSEKT